MAPKGSSKGKKGGKMPGQTPTEDFNDMDNATFEATLADAEERINAADAAAQARRSHPPGRR